MNKLTNILKEISHPFIGFLPNQEKISQKISWYNEVKGVLESSSLEFVTPILYCSIKPSLPSLIFGTAVALDGLWRINKIEDDSPNTKYFKRYPGTTFLEMPYNFLKNLGF